MTEREKHQAIQTFNSICQISANTGITAARHGDTDWLTDLTERALATIHNHKETK